MMLYCPRPPQEPRKITAKFTRKVRGSIIANAIGKRVKLTISEDERPMHMSLSKHEAEFLARDLLRAVDELDGRT